MIKMAWKNKLKTLCSKWFEAKEEQPCIIIPRKTGDETFYYDSSYNKQVTCIEVIDRYYLIIKGGTRQIYGADGTYDLTDKNDINTIMIAGVTTQQEI